MLLIFKNRLLSFLIYFISFPFISPSTYCQTIFTNVTESAGIAHQFVVYEGMFGGGICVFDLDRDGFEDLYVTSGMNEDVLYKNNRNGTFTNIYEGSGLELTRKFVTQGVVGADVNRDGWVDLFITTITSKDSAKQIPRARNLLFLNNGDQTFRDVTDEFGLTPLYSFSTGGSFGDFNADGYPDLYVGNYFKEYDGELSEINDATIVNANQTAKGYLLKNNKGKSFSNVYEDYGLDHKGFSFGAVFTDYDNDSDLDIIVNHDFGYKAKPCYFLENRYPRKSFRYIEEELEMDLKINAMGAAVGDYNEDGYFDYFVTNIRFNHFMVSQGAGKPFVNKLKELDMDRLAISWGANFADFDHDGDLDLYVANGDLNPNCVPMADFYFENENAQFTERAAAVGLNDYGLGRGSVAFDMENDGDLDIMVVNQKAVLDYGPNTTTQLYRNDSTKGNWLKIALQGIHAESHGLGSRVEVVIGDRRMMREIDGGNSSHLSQNSVIAHFGLGEANVVDSVIVRWLGGKKQILVNQNANQLLKIIETGNNDGSSLILKLVSTFLIFAVGILGYRIFYHKNA